MPTPKDQQVPKGARPFTDREGKIEAFWKLFHRAEVNQYSILSFYGVGGIGKTRLRQELISQLRTSAWANDVIVSSVLDFDTRDHQPSLRDMERALYALRNELHKHGVPFRAFDIAYAHYWEQTHPEAALKQKEIPFINEGSAILDLFGGAKDLVESLQNAAGWIVGAGMLPKALTLIQALKKAGQDWLTVRAVERLQQLNSLQPHQLLGELSYFLAYDIRAYQQSQGKRFVFFLDTYEALWWEAPQSRSVELWLTRDEWIRELIAELPHTLWVIGGRNKLRWEELDDWGEYLTEMLMGELSETDAERYLRGTGIDDQGISSKIIQSSQGLPFALELQVDQFERIRQSRPPTPSDFADRSNKLIQRFLEYLMREERETLRVLSVALVWDSELFRELIRQFQTGYPATALAELSQFSFISREEDYYRMHSLMREELQDSLVASLRIECHQFLFKYYDQQLEDMDHRSISSKHEFALETALYHRLNSDELDIAVGWFLSYADKFVEARRLALILRLALDLRLRWDSLFIHGSEALYRDLLNSIGLVYAKQGQYEAALGYYQRSLAISEAVSGEQHPDTATILNNIGETYDLQGQYEDALVYLQRSLAIYQAVLGEQHPDTAKALNNIGLIYAAIGQYEDALVYLQRSLAIYQAVLGEQHFDISMPLNNIGLIYANKGQYETALGYYQRSLAISEAVLGEQHPDTAIILSNIGVVYDLQDQHEAALGYLQRSLSIHQTLLEEQHPSTAISLNLIGMVYANKGQYEDALVYLQRSLSISEAVLGEQHPDTAIVLNNIGLIYNRKGQHEAALVYFQRSLAISQVLLGEQHPDTATTLNNIGEAYAKQGQYEAALGYYQRSLVVYQAMLGEQHPNTATILNNIGETYDLQGQYEDALVYLQHSLSIRQAMLGEQHFRVISTNKLIMKIKNILGRTE